MEQTTEETPRTRAKILHVITNEILEPSMRDMRNQKLILTGVLCIVI